MSKFLRAFSQVSLATYGQALGIAFQMSDDIMDLVGKPGLMGKGYSLIRRATVR